MKNKSPQTFTLNNKWVAVHVRVNREKVTADTLSIQGYECFLPLCYYKNKVFMRPDIKKTKALFPGYLFCRYKSEYNYRIIQAPGVIGVVGHGGTPYIIPEDEMSSLFKIVHSELNMEPNRYIAVGQVVEISSGPLRGIKGILQTDGIRPKVVVSVSLLRRSVAVEISSMSLSVL
jgi:transcription termination/antitermination protein NusG